MKSIHIFWLLTLIFAANGYAQGPTGINTLNALPSQQLHVSGTTNNPGIQILTTGIFTVKPTIRIDGLNKANNNAANGAYSIPPLLTAPPYSWPATSSSVVQPVSVNQDGDMLLSSDYVIPLVATQLGSDALAATTITAPPVTAPNPPPGSGQDGTLTGNIGYIFTLKQTCMVHFIASVSVSIYKKGTTNLITDGRARLYNVFFRFTSASYTNPTGNPLLITATAPGLLYQFGTDGNTYSNYLPTIPGIYDVGTAGDMYVNPEAYLVLPPGTYKADLWGRVFGYDYNFDAVFGGGTDMVSIIATPLN